MVVNLCDLCVVVVVRRSVQLFLWVYERVHLCADSESVQVGEVQDSVLRHEWSGVCFGRAVRDKAYQSLLCPD